MRIHTENTNSYLFSLASSLTRDPASLEGWRSIHVEIHEKDTDGHRHSKTEQLIKKLKGEFKHLDADVVLCTDGDIVIITRTQGDAIYQYVSELVVRLECNPKLCETHVYDLFHDWQHCTQLLLLKIDGQAIITAHDDGVEFAGAQALTEVFNAAKLMRRSRQPAHILLVEDEPVTRKMVTNLFKDSFAIITAKDAEEAIANYLLYAPDIVFLDINLPDHNGFAVLKQIIANDPEAYVVMFSGNSYLDNVTHALNTGAAGFVAKPFSKEKMRHYITGATMHHRKACM